MGTDKERKEEEGEGDGQRVTGWVEGLYAILTLPCYFFLVRGERGRVS